jgi:predicted ATPase/class 3 adenylate cyclase
VSFLFTDVVDSARLWDRHPRQMAVALSVHDQIVRGAIEKHGGVVFATAGDSFAAAFSTAADALAAAIAIQQRLAVEPWPEPVVVSVRVGLHTGEAHERGGDYFGGAVNRAARIMAMAHGGQILVSGVTQGLGAEAMGADYQFSSVGQVALRGLERPEQLHQLEGPGLPSGFPPLAAAAGPVSLPRPITTLFGRHHEMEQLADDLAVGRLVTVVGFGGVGKTRLAIETAHRLRSDFPHGVWFVDLAPVSASEAVPSAVARAIGAAEEPGRSVVDSVVARLEGGAALVVLDNCEHVLAAAASLVDAALTGCPELHIVATSRQALGVAGEQVMPLGPLPTDTDDAPGVQLFVDRARHVRPDFCLTEANRHDVRAICAALDGISLAIELAAARMRAVTPTELAARLADPFALLRGSAGAPARHRTLLSTVEWSYQLLSPREQDMFDRLAVFAGPFDLDAAEAIGASGRLDPYEVDDVLDALADKSLVIVEHRSTTTTFRLLDTLRQYGKERLVARGLYDEAHRAHAQYYGVVTAHIASDWASPRQLEANTRMDECWANLREACAWATDAGEVELGADILLPVFIPVIYRLGYELGDWAARLAASDAAAKHPLTPQLLGFAVLVSWFRGDYEAVATMTARACELEAALGIPPHWLASYGWSLLPYVHGDAAGLAVQVQSAHTLITDHPPADDDAMLRVFRCYNRTNALTAMGRPTDECMAVAQAGVVAAEASGSPGLLAVALSARVGQRVRQEEPDAEGAWADARRAIALAQHADVRYVLAIALGHGLQAASLLADPEGFGEVLPDFEQWAEPGNTTNLWRVVGSALPLLWRREERLLAIRVRVTMDANPWRRLGPLVEATVREIDLVVPEAERPAAAVSQEDMLALLRDVLDALRSRAR